MARECIGTPFIHQGRVVGRGLDCAGLIIHIFKRLQLPFNDLSGYPEAPYKDMLFNQLNSEPSLIKKPRSELKPGDVMLFTINRHPQHLAINAGDAMIHAYSVAGKVIEQSIGAWNRKLTGVYRFE